MLVQENKKLKRKEKLLRERQKLQKLLETADSEAVVQAALKVLRKARPKLLTENQR